MGAARKPARSWPIVMGVCWGAAQAARRTIKSWGCKLRATRWSRLSARRLPTPRSRPPHPRRFFLEASGELGLQLDPVTPVSEPAQGAVRLAARLIADGG